MKVIQFPSRQVIPNLPTEVQEHLSVIVKCTAGDVVMSEDVFYLIVQLLENAPKIAPEVWQEKVSPLLEKLRMVT